MFSFSRFTWQMTCYNFTHHFSASKKWKRKPLSGWPFPWYTSFLHANIVTPSFNESSCPLFVLLSRKTVTADCINWSQSAIRNNTGIFWFGPNLSLMGLIGEDMETISGRQSRQINTTSQECVWFGTIKRKTRTNIIICCA